jgi:hypothetical protein
MCSTLWYIPYVVRLRGFLVRNLLIRISNKEKRFKMFLRSNKLNILACFPGALATKKEFHLIDSRCQFGKTFFFITNGGI